MLIANGRKIEIGHYPDGTLLLNDTEWVEISSYVAIEWYYEGDGELFALYALTRHLQNLYCGVTLFMPYIPNARMDRTKDDNDVFTLKYFAEIINALGFEYVEVLDPHSAVSEALLDSIVIRTPSEYIAETIKNITRTVNENELLLFYPDEGAMKRYTELIGRPYAFGVKRRDWKTGKILSLDVIGDKEQIQGKTILIVDDICSKGGTFYYSAKALKELGAGDIYLYVTHCENTILKGQLLTSGLIEHVFATNSICTVEHEKITKFELKA